MTEQVVTTARAEDYVSVGTRISWGAILAGAALALGVYSLLAILGAAVGLSVSERVNPSTLKATAIVWTLVTMVAALFVGGMVTSQFTVGESKTEAMLYGVIMWAVLFAFLALLSAAGVRAGYSALVGMANLSEQATTESWDKMARADGVPADQIDAWRKLRTAPEKTTTPAEETQNYEIRKEAVTRITWYAFAGTWLSMIAAAIGAMIGAGPTFKIVSVRTVNRPLS